MASQLSDAEQILRVHRDWYYSNININIPLMRTVFPTGDENFLMFDPSPRRRGPRRQDQSQRRRGPRSWQTPYSTGIPVDFTVYADA